jgi:hypothetical protein
MGLEAYIMTFLYIIAGIVGLLVLRYLLAEVLLHPASGIVGILLFAVFSFKERVFHTLFWNSDLEAKFLGIIITVVFIGALSMLAIAWRRNGAFTRVIPRMFPII